jgi:hypothetical protein
MTQVGMARAANGFNTGNLEGSVSAIVNGDVRNRFVKTGPAAVRFIFACGRKKGCITTRTVIETAFKMLAILAGMGGFRSF